MSDKKLIFVFLMLFMVPFAFAESFTFYSGAEIDDVCPRSTGLFSDVIENTGDEILEFNVASSGSASVFATTVPTGFVLYPGEIKNIYTYITPMSSVDIGNYVLKIDADADGVSQSISHDIYVRDCYDYTFEGLDGEANICPCEETKFGFELTNLGEYSETYDLSVEGRYSDSIVLSQNSLSLTPGESKVIYAYVESNCESASGNYEFSVKVDPSTGSAVRSQVAKLVIDPCYDFDVDTAQDLINMCEHESQVIPINVENTGSTPNTYSFDLNGPVWANLERNELEIAAGNSRDVNLELVPDYGVEGSFEITFSATPEKGNVQAVNVFNVNVKKCYDISTKLEKSEDKICNALENTYNVIVRNQGEFEKDFFVDVDGPSWASVDETSVSLGAGEEQQITLRVFPQYDTEPGEYDVSVNVAAKDSNQIASSDSMVIETVTTTECYDASLNVEDAAVEVYYDSSATVPVVVENKGADRAAYSLSVSGTASNFVYLNPSVVEVEPGKSEIVYLYVAPSSQISNGEYSTTVSVRLEDSTILASENVDIKITDSPEKRVDYSPVGDEVQGESFISRFFGFFADLFSSTPEEIIEEEISEEETEEEVVEEETPEEEVEEETEEETSEEETEEEVVEEETPEEEVEEEATESLMSLGETSEFMVGEEQHTLTVSDRSGDVLLIQFSSDPIYVQMFAGDVKEVDLDGDGVNDVEVTFGGFVGDKADLSYKVLNQPESGEEATEEEVVEEETPEEEVEEETEEETPEVDMGDITGEVTEEVEGDGNSFFGSFFSSLKGIFVGLGGAIVGYSTQLALLVIVIIVLVVLAKTNFWSKMAKFFEEEIEEEKVAGTAASPASVTKKEEKPKDKPKKEESPKKEEKPKDKPKKEEAPKKEAKKEEKPKEDSKKETPKAEEEDEFVIEFDDDE